VMGAMFTGYATATEAASFGVLGALAIAWWSGSLTGENLWASLMGATRLSCMILFILAGAAFLSSCMAFTGVPRALAEWVVSLNASPFALIAVLALIYLLLVAVLLVRPLGLLGKR
jgi:TRAP-type C4-dicarboxylate transport system permease large subunit